jgi:surface antigen
MKQLIVLCSVLFVLLGCAPGTQQGQGIGTMAGAIIGGVIGHQIGGGSGKAIATVVGAVAGGLMGSEVGRVYDKLNAEEQRVHTSTLSNTIQTSRIGEGNQWYNPETGHSGRVIITEQEGYCREYQQTIVIGGQEQQAYGTACRQPDGSWKIQN